MRYFISILFLLAAGNSMAQLADTLKSDFTPTGIRFGVDAVSLAYTFSSDDIHSQLFSVDVDFYRYFLVGEFGVYERTRAGTNGDYHTKGSYWRIGADVNFMQHDPDKSVMSFGLRYGNSYFSDELTTVQADPVYGTRTLSFQNDNLNADWFELVAGLKVPVWKFWMGYNVRLKFGIDKFEDLQFRPYEAPGYGLAGEKDYWEFNYFLMYRIAWRD